MLVRPWPTIPLSVSTSTKQRASEVLRWTPSSLMWMGMFSGVALTRAIFMSDVSGVPMQPVIDRQQQAADCSGIRDQQERHRYDDVDVVQTDCGHQQVSKAALRRKHLAEQRADQGQ